MAHTIDQMHGSRALAVSSGFADRPHLRLFALSFLSLFLELTIIRWVPGSVKFVTYYANLMLISSFLGLGLGAMLAERGRTSSGGFLLYSPLTCSFLRCRDMYCFLAARSSYGTRLSQLASRATSRYSESFS